jgi:hypothetical protein
MIRFAALALLFSTALTAAAAAQTVAPSATPTNGAVGSAAQRNGYPAVGGAVSLPSIANSSTTTTAPLAGTTSSPAFLSSPTSTSATGVGLGGTGQTGGSGGAGNFSGGAGGGGQPRGGAGSSNLGGGNTAGVATATVPSGSGANWVICPPNGAPGLEPLFTGTDLSCAPQ